MSAHHKKEAYLHFCVSLIGGFLGGYTILNHCDLLAAAQTANMINIVRNIINFNFSTVIYMLLSLFVYISGMAVCTVIKKRTKIDVRAFSLALTSAAVIATASLPYAINDYLAMLPLIFALPVQWIAFSDCLGYSSSTVFSTNNLRQTVTAFTHYAIDKDKKQLKKAQFFGTTLLFFHIGVASACIAHIFAGAQSVWFCFVFIAISALCYVWGRKFTVPVLFAKRNLKAGCLGAQFVQTGQIKK